MQRANRVLGSLLLVASALAAACNTPLPVIQPGSALAGVFALPEAPQQPVYRITPKRSQDIDELAKRGMDIFTVRKGYVEGRPTADALQYAKDQDLGLDAVKATFGDSGGLPVGYQPYESMMARLREVATTYPNLATLVDLGPTWQTVQGQGTRKVFGIRLTAGKGDKPKVLFTAGQHARELAPPEVAMRLIDELTKGYGKDAALTKLMDTREAWIVPVVNPDGRVEVERGTAMWRKNRHVMSRAVGVDLNRNFDSHWSGGDTNPGSDAFHGESAFSEPEIHGIRDLMNREKFTVAMDYHAYAGAVIWPPGWNRGNSPDQATFAKIGAVLTQSNGYDADTIARRFYLAPGSIADWAYDKHGIMAFGCEMGDSFRPPSSQLPKYYSEIRDGAMHLLSIADNPKGTGRR